MSSEALKQAEESQIRNIESSTGKSIAEWVAIIKNSGFEKHGELVSFLKKEHQLGHGNANLLVHQAKKYQNGPANEDDLVVHQYQGKENLKRIYDVLIQSVKGFGNDVAVSPKKTYVSLRRKKQFAIVQPSTKSRLDIGLNLKRTEATGKLEAAGSWNAMCSHRIRLEKEEDLDQEALQWLKIAYDEA